MCINEMSKLSSQIEPSRKAVVLLVYMTKGSSLFMFHALLVTHN